MQRKCFHVLFIRAFERRILQGKIRECWKAELTVLSMGHLDCDCNFSFCTRRKMVERYYKSKTNFLAENICSEEKVHNELTES